jgi:predicted dienelactone hydrolase
VGLKTDLVVHDAARNKDLRVVAVYPQGPGPYPVIVFSHGGGGSPRSYMTLSRYWASHGYVVLLPTHADSRSLQPDPDNRLQRGEGLRTVFIDAPAWVNRPKDVSFLLDSLVQLEQMAPELTGKLDPTKIGVGGHSFGAFTAQVIGGATLTLPGQTGPVSLADERVKAVLMLSGQGPGQMGLTEHSWENFRLPAMGMTGSLDRGALGQGPEWRRRAFELSPPGDKYFVFIEGASHFSFNDLSGPLARLQQPQREAVSGYIRMASLAFWDAYLRGDAQARAYLESDGLAQYSQGAVTISRR